jgi:hypothetical protein
MERSDTDGAYDSQQAGPGVRAEKSRRRSGENSNDDPEKEGTAIAGRRPNDFAVELSLLQSVYEQAISAGLRAKTTQLATTDGQIPVLTIQLWNVSKCPICGSWIVGQTCPIC